MQRKPKQFEPLWAIGALKPDEPMALTYSKERGFLEPVTNRDARPVIGKIIAWTYRVDKTRSDKDAYIECLRLAKERDQ